MSNALRFDSPGLATWLTGASTHDIDELDFGVIEIDLAGLVSRYGRFESQASGLSVEQVIGRPFFTLIAPCMNNFMVAQRFEDAQAQGAELDVIIDYVLTLRMRPLGVKLRLLASTRIDKRYVLVQRKPG